MALLIASPALAPGGPAWAPCLSSVTVPGVDVEVDPEVEVPASLGSESWGFGDSMLGGTVGGI